ncbi:TRAP transporter small permease [Clostridium vitabionis]|uniref:TRAP transporter small permease n=1 Tax=Clostridium vitabionis TaxID=2784388 RepID=UPI00188C76C6|nr:TRAP transporter small permease [Clostridium vitabionis]
MKILKWLDLHLEEAILCILLALLACVMMIQVLMRYFLNSPLTWAEEFCRYCFVYSVMLATGYCIRTNRMLKVDAVIVLFSKKVQYVMDIISKVMATIFCAILILPSWHVMMGTKIGALWQTSPAMHLPMVILYSCAPAGFILGTFRGIQSIILTIQHHNKEAGNSQRREGKQA